MVAMAHRLSKPRGWWHTPACPHHLSQRCNTVL